MITLGVGIDIVAVDAFALQLEDAASGFVEETFTPRERRACEGPDPLVRARRLAARFAAKEAVVKAWSSARAGRPPVLAAVDMREIEVIDDGYGRPAIRPHGAVAAGLDALAAEHGATGRVAVQVSLTHDGPTAGAMVLLTAG